jgi:glutamate dehydrogenase (NADP+)
MASTTNYTLHHDQQQFLKWVKNQNPGQVEFHQAVEEFLNSIWQAYSENESYKRERILERMTEPDRVVSFRVVWENDKGGVEINRGYRVQFNNAIGPYKGGLRFHPSVNVSILKFLGFEQIFKNSLTGLAMGGAKGGADFNPKGRSDREVMRFCHAYMEELQRYIGPDEDVPAGDIGVGGREINYLFGHYKKLNKTFKGVLTGKDLFAGGSLIRPEATGYGAVYFAEDMLQYHQRELAGRVCVVSGSGNVAQHAAEKLLAYGAQVVAMSDSKGFFYDAKGLDAHKLHDLKELKNKRRGSLRDFAQAYGLPFYSDESPWSIACEIAFPCATQNELNLTHAKLLHENGCLGVVEGANMPCTNDAINYMIQNEILFAPGKAANAGGVAVSGLEMAQNSMRISWAAAEVEQRLHAIMSEIHQQCVAQGQDPAHKHINYVDGANRASFKKVADAMVAYGLH